MLDAHESVNPLLVYGQSTSVMEDLHTLINNFFDNLFAMFSFLPGDFLPYLPVGIIFAVLALAILLTMLGSMLFLILGLFSLVEALGKGIIKLLGKR